MEASRELDATIAEKVMGVTWPEANCRICGWPKAADIRGGCLDGNCSLRPSPPVRADLPARYSTDIAAAWTVVEKMREVGWLVSVKSMPATSSFIMEGSRSEYDSPMPDHLFGKGRVACEMSWMGDGFRPREWAVTDTAPLSICRTALAAAQKRDSCET